MKGINDLLPFSKNDFLDWLDHTDRTCTNPPSTGCPITQFLTDRGWKNAVTGIGVAAHDYDDMRASPTFYDLPPWANIVVKAYDDKFKTRSTEIKIKEWKPVVADAIIADAIRTVNNEAL
jgi:hypothetical protein